MPRFPEEEALMTPINFMGRLKKLWQQIVSHYGLSEGRRWKKDLWVYACSEKDLKELEALVERLLNGREKLSAEAFRLAVLDWLMIPGNVLTMGEKAGESKLKAFTERREAETRRADEERAGREAAEARIKALEERLAATGLEEEETAVPSKRPRG